MLPEFSPKGKNIMLLIHFSTHARSCRGCWNDSVSGSTLWPAYKFRLWSHGCFKILHRGVSIISPSIFKQSFVYFSVVTSLDQGEQLEIPTAVSCFSSTGLTHPAVASALFVHALPYTAEAVADFDKVPGPSAAKLCIQRCLMAFLVPSLQGLSAKIRPWIKGRAAHAVNFIHNWKSTLCASQETVCIPCGLRVDAHERKIEGNGPWRFEECRFTLVQA